LRAIQGSDAGLVRVVAFAFLTPFFFIKGGLNVSLGAVLANPGLLAVLVAAEMVNTGLTFGTISSLYGLNAGFINRTQFSLLVTVVLLSAVVPTELAERWFLPDADQERHVELRHPPLPAEE
jgi:Kef-type K+ transport system membrane component KefB